MGNNYCKTLINPNTPLTLGQFKKICNNYSKTYLDHKEAKQFLNDIAEAYGVTYDKKIAKDIIAEIDENNSGYLTTKQFQILFFTATDCLGLAMTTSLRHKKEDLLNQPQPPQPPPLPSKRIKRKKKIDLTESQPPSWVFQPKISISADISNLKWTEALGFEKSDKGSTGVFFVGWKDNQVAVLKGSSTALADSFANNIATWAGIAVPKMKIIKFPKDPQFQEIIRQLDELDEEKPERLQGSHSQMRQIPILCLLEFISGSEFSSADFKKLLKPGTKEAYDHCFGIGKLIAFDVFINNWDRLPIIWDSKEGNVDNIVFSNNPSTPVIGIDQSITAIIDNENSDKYLSRVEELMSQLSKFDNKNEENFPLVTKTRDFLKIAPGISYDIGPEGTHSVWHGMMQGVVDIVKNVDEQKLTELRKNYELAVEEVFEGMSVGQDKFGLYGLTRVNVSFLVEILGRFNKFVDKFVLHLKQNK